MKGRSDIPRIIGRLRPSKRLTSTQVLSQCAAMGVGTGDRAAHQFLQATMSGGLIFYALRRLYSFIKTGSILNMQIVRYNLFKCSKYASMLKLKQKCNFLLLPSNHACSKLQC